MIHGNITLIESYMTATTSCAEYLMPYIAIICQATDSHMSADAQSIESSDRTLCPQEDIHSPGTSVTLKLLAKIY